MEGHKICSKCKVTKVIAMFYRHSGTADKLDPRCKECHKAQGKANYLKTKDARKKVQKKYYETNKKEYLKKCAIYRRMNRDKLAKYHVEYRNNPENLDKIRTSRNKRVKIRLMSDIQYKMRLYLRNRVRAAIRAAGSRKCAPTLHLVGCDVIDLVKFLEKKFTDGMTWDNYGKWHVDHIRPCSSFDLTDPEQQKQCFHYTNLQPLWAKDNLKKSNKIINQEVKNG